MPTLVTPKNGSPARQLMLERASLLTNLPPIAHTRPGYAELIYPSPVIPRPGEHKTFEYVHEALSIASTSIVRNYFNDSDLQRLVPLSADVHRSLKLLETLPYGSDLLRPDFVFDKNSGRPLLCEINCRFPLNGFLMSSLLDRAFNERNSRPAEFTALDKVVQELNEKTRGRISIVKGRETGFDIHLLRAQNPSARIVAPDEIDWRKHASARVLLELHQDELSTVIEPVCRFMLNGGSVVNDPRTVFVVHDKRFLCALSSEAVLERYLDDPALRRILLDHVVPTFGAGRDPCITREARKHPSQWVAKRAISGKSDGVWIGASTPRSTWNKVVDHPEVVLQPFIEQPVHTMYDPWMCYEKTITANIIATTLSIQNGPFEMGMYRMFVDGSANLVGFTTAKRRSQY